MLFEQQRRCAIEKINISIAAAEQRFPLKPKDSAQHMKIDRSHNWEVIKDAEGKPENSEKCLCGIVIENGYMRILKVAGQSNLQETIIVPAKELIIHLRKWKNILEILEPLTPAGDAFHQEAIRLTEPFEQLQVDPQFKWFDYDNALDQWIENANHQQLKADWDEFRRQNNIDALSDKLEIEVEVESTASQELDDQLMSQPLVDSSNEPSSDEEALEAELAERVLQAAQSAEVQQPLNLDGDTKITDIEEARRFIEAAEAWIVEREKEEAEALAAQKAKEEAEALAAQRAKEEAEAQAAKKAKEEEQVAEALAAEIINEAANTKANALDDALRKQEAAEAQQALDSAKAAEAKKAQEIEEARLAKRAKLLEATRKALEAEAAIRAQDAINTAAKMKAAEEDRKAAEEEELKKAADEKKARQAAEEEQAKKALEAQSTEASEAPQEAAAVEDVPIHLQEADALSQLW
jgi:colicin import membrane protein